jgi:acyl-CoA synthetase (AMP-forming)/AMP-acid ligase II
MSAGWGSIELPGGAALRENRIGCGLAEWARTDPDRVAIRARTRSITFGELEALVGTLAGTLADRASTMAADAIVPILVERDLWSVVAIHAAIRAGVPFAPLDGLAGANELVAVWDRLGRSDIAVVGGPDAASSLPSAVTPLPVPRRPGHLLEPQELDPAATAAVVFTSGSTGTPKGIVYDWALLDSTFRWNDDPFVSGAANAHADCLFGFTFVAGIRRALGLSSGRSFSLVDPSGLGPEQLIETLDVEEVECVGFITSLA